MLGSSAWGCLIIRPIRALATIILSSPRSKISETPFLNDVRHRMNLTERITIDPEICHGKPVIRGLRYPVETILELLSSGMTTDEILADYEDLEQDDILAVLAYAARLRQVN